MVVSRIESLLNKVAYKILAIYLIYITVAGPIRYYFTKWEYTYLIYIPQVLTLNNACFSSISFNEVR